MKRRLLSLLMAMLMVFSLLPVTALASDVEPLGEPEEIVE